MRTLALVTDSSWVRHTGRRGLAVNSLGTLMAVSCDDASPPVALYSLPDGAFIRGIAVSARSVCFSPATGNLIAADGCHNHVQVCLDPCTLPAEGV